MTGACSSSSKAHSAGKSSNAVSGCVACCRINGGGASSAAKTDLRGRLVVAPVAIAGFSFGAGPALLAAADLPGVRVVGSFGGYADLRNVIAYITTGVFRGATR